MMNPRFPQLWNGQTIHTTPPTQKGTQCVSKKNGRDRFEDSVSRRNKGGAAIAWVFSYRLIRL